MQAEEAAEVCYKTDEIQLYDLKARENKSYATHYNRPFHCV